MMYVRSFDEFMEQRKQEFNVTHAKMTYAEFPEHFELYFKAKELHYVATVVLKQDLVQFGGETGLSPEESLKSFKDTVLANADLAEASEYSPLYIPPEPLAIPDVEYDEGSAYITTGLKEYLSKATEVEEVVHTLVNDPSFKPKDGKTKEQAAWELCESKFGHDMVHKSGCSCIICKASENVPVSEADDYASWLSTQYSNWADKVVAALERTKLDKKLEYKKKIGLDFWNELFTPVNQQAFQEKISGFVRESMVNGLSQAERELDVDVGINPLFGEQVRALTNQQIKGYYVGDKFWPGIKGVTDQIREDVLDLVEAAVVNRTPKKELVAQVREKFRQASRTSAERIARTETNRFFNTGKLVGMNSAGVRGLKTWEAINCCDECAVMEKKYDDGIPMTEPFITVEGRAIMTPPYHPNCRCTVGFKFNPE